MEPRLRITGDGQKSTILKPDDTVTCFEWIPGAENEHFCKLTEFTVVGVGKTGGTSGHGIYLENVNGGVPSELFLVDVYIREMPEDGVHFEHGWSCRIERSTIETNGRDNIYVAPNSNRNLHVSNCFLAYAGRYNAWIRHNETTFRNNWLYYGDTHGLSIEGSENLIIGNWIFGNSQSSAGTYDGIAVSGNNNAIVGNVHRGSLSGTSEQYGVDVASGATDNRVEPAQTLGGWTSGSWINDAGTRTRVNGVGSESASAETPTAANWTGGDIVDFTDSGDGSGNGVYLLLADGTWAQVA